MKTYSANSVKVTKRHKKWRKTIIVSGKYEASECIRDVKQRELWLCKITSFGFVLERNHGYIVLEWTVYDVFELFEASMTMYSNNLPWYQWLNEIKPNPRSFTSLQFTSSCERWNVLGDVVVAVCLVLNIKPLVIFVSDKTFEWKIEESNLNQEQCGRQYIVIPLRD